MRAPFIERRSKQADSRRSERGATMALVAVAMLGVIAMAGVSIDIGTLYQASAEAQRSADAAALAAARVISMSGLTTDPNNSPDWSPICGPPNQGINSLATQAAIATAQQNSVAGASNLNVTVMYSSPGGAANTDCTAAGSGFGINPLVTVSVTQSNMPVYFLRMWGTTASSVTATATAEAFNASTSSLAPTPVSYATWPRCVKPWVVPNSDPDHAIPSPQSFISTATPGAIQDPGIFPTGVIGETFTLTPDCNVGSSSCSLISNPPIANPGTSTLQYVPGQVPPSATAVPSCSTSSSATVLDPYAQAIAGCDQTTQYQCGNMNRNNVDLTEWNPANGDTTLGGQCLIHQTSGTAAAGNGQDALAAATPGVPPPNYPFQILAGGSNPAVTEGLTSGAAITSSTSIATVPIYNGSFINTGNPNPQITIIGFLQVFINYVDASGDVNVTVMNVVGCGSDPTATTTFTGTSPVPVRLITQQ